jgi:hypothetical protein
VIFLKYSEIKENIKNNLVDKTFIESMLKRTYIPFLEKRVIVEELIDSFIYEEDGLIKVDLFDKQFFTNLKILSVYFDIENDLEFSELMELYDLLLENNYFSAFQCYIKDDLSALTLILESVLNEKIKYNNTLEGIIAKGINKLIDKLPDEKGMSKLIKDLPKQVNKIDPSKLKYVSDIVGWNNGTKKPEGETK